ncbi:MAG TPA: hypothetical protein PKV88_06120 [Bacteroidales bacterium]|nr:hypothetical protein [Bacteroidales bacterium]HRX00410.1 hypothetical protein [Cyclobacteriaceae bacterium]
MQNEEKIADMFELVEQWQESGKSQQQFSKEQNIKLATFNYWVKKHRQQKVAEIGFAKVDFGQHSIAPTAAKVEIELAAGMVIRIF